MFMLNEDGFIICVKAWNMSICKLQMFLSLGSFFALSFKQSFKNSVLEMLLKIKTYNVSIIK